MTPQLTWLAAALALTFVHIFLTAAFKRRQDGMKWAAGNRDGQPTYTGAAARLDRAQANLYETVFIFAAAILIAAVAHRDGPLNLWGARVFVVGRIFYVAAYGFGFGPLRSAIYMVATTGLVLTLIPLF